MRDRFWLLLALSLVFAACGGSSDSTGSATVPASATTTEAPATTVASTTTVGSIPRTEYAARVNTLCSSTVEEIDAALIPVIQSYIAELGAAASDEESLTDEQVMGLYAATRPVAEDMSEEFGAMLSEIRSLPQSDADADMFSEHWDRVEALWMGAYEAIVTASSDPVAARSLLAEPDSRLAPTNEIAVTLGIEQCVFD